MSQSAPILRVAAKAIIVNEKDQILIVREASTYDEGTNIGHYGLPGGRVEIGESFMDGLKREVREEVSLEIEPLYPVQVGEWHPVIKGRPHQIIAIFMACRVKAGTISLSQEHDQFEWINPKQRAHYNIMNPDREVIDTYLKRLITNK
jgi:8-oxo-dGTP diphosphatase